MCKKAGESRSINEEENLGEISSLLFSNWLNSALYTAEVILGFYFLRHFSPSRLQVGYIASALFIDAVCSAVVFANTYLVSKLQMIECLY